MEDPTQTFYVGFNSDKYRVALFKNEFADRDAAKITTAEIKEFFNAQNWKRGTFRRCKTTLMGIYRVGVERGLVDVNPAKTLKVPKRQMEDNSDSDERNRYLNQFPPLSTELEYLKPFTTEEDRLRAVITHDYPEHLETFEVALNTGMRRKDNSRAQTTGSVLPRMAIKSLCLPARMARVAIYH